MASATNCRPPETGETRRIFISYHPSQRNTSTKTLTAPMLDNVLGEINHFLERPHKS